MVRKAGLGKDVLTATRERISLVLDEFEHVYVSFSGGKDSSIMLHLVMEQVIARGRRVGVLFIDLEAQYKLTIEHVREMFALYADHIDPYWVALPIALRNAVSNFQPKWQCWDPDSREMWVREPDPASITDPALFPFFHRDQEFEEFIEFFGEWYGKGEPTACLVGIRSDESLNRFRTLMADKAMFRGHRWTTWLGGAVFNAYPIYDWRTEDLWTFSARSGLPYNRLYDRMHKAGLSIHQQRICQPYGDDQRKGLWLYHIIEPDTWGRVVARVNGANSGALYAQESGNVLGRIKIALPPGHTWESFSRLLLATLPPNAREHYEDKVAVFLRWWMLRGYSHGIPDDGPANDKDTPSWKRIAKCLLRNDWWCKGLSFTQHQSQSYERYRKIMKKRRALWGII
jgi:predicted phosphoadenosine phosphosulfate sulfurtransferase